MFKAEVLALSCRYMWTSLRLIQCSDFVLWSDDVCIRRNRRDLLKSTMRTKWHMSC